MRDDRIDVVNFVIKHIHRDYQSDRPLPAAKYEPLVTPELRDQKLSSSSSVTFGLAFLLQRAMEENPICITEPPEMMQLLLWTTGTVFGIVYILLGYRFLRAIGFLSGLAAGSGCILWIQKQNITLFGNPTDSALAVVAGLLGAVLGSTHPIASALVSGFAGAIVASVTMAICVVSLPHHVFGEREIVVAICGGAIIFAVLTLCCTKLVTILTSSIVGATMILLSVDFFMHDLGTLKWIITLTPNPAPPPCWGGVIVFMWPVFIIVGVLVQSFITAWRIDHKKRHFNHLPLVTGTERMPRHTSAAMVQHMGAGGNGGAEGHSGLSRSKSNNGRPPETKEEARQRKYRYLYQVRTAHGDIISKNYVSALQQRYQQPGSPSEPSSSTKTGSHERDHSFRSDRTRMTNLIDTNSGERRHTVMFDCDA